MGRTVLLLTLLTFRALAVEEPTPPGGEPPKVNLALPQKYAVGARVRYLFAPSSFFAPYLQANTSMNSASVGLEFIYRKDTYDVVTSLDFSYLNVDDGNWLANGHPADMDSHYVQFRDLSFLSVDVSIIGHHTWAAAPWFELRYGAGVGLGVVLGDVLLINNSTACTTANVNDTKACHPTGVDLNSPNREAQLKATEGGGTDTALTPHRHSSEDKWPAAPVLNILVGAMFRVHPHLTVNVELGFRDAMFFGAGLHYWF